MDKVVGDMLTQLAEGNGERVGEPSFYDAAEVPGIAVADLVRRWVKYSKAPGEVVPMAMVLIDRAVEGGVVLTTLSVHRVLISALVVATKMHCDQVYCNSHYAKVCGISRQELNRLEVAFLNDVDFETHIGEEKFAAVCEIIRRLVSKDLPKSPRSPKKKRSPKRL